MASYVFPSTPQTGKYPLRKQPQSLPEDPPSPD
jgi:hypothetical protein